MTLPAAKRIIKATWRAIAIIPLLSLAFTPNYVQLRHNIIPDKVHNYSLLRRLPSSSPNQNNHESSNPNTVRNSSNNKNTVARAGGRRPRIPSSKSKNPDWNSFIAAVRQFALPLFALTFALKFILGIFGGGSNDPNVVYYSRSVYQSSTYTRNGNVETIRKENFQSNIPELVKQSQRNEGGVNSGGYFDIIDKDMEDEIDSLLYQRW